MRTLLAILAIPILVAGCAGGSSGGNPSGSTAPTAASRYAVGTGPESLILRVSTEGGFIAPGYLLTAIPQFALYGDGRVIVPGPVDAIYPGPLLPNLRQLQLAPAEIQRLLAAADADGLLGADASYAQANVMDAGTTTFTTTVDGKTHTISANALGASAVAVDASDAAARAKLLDFQGKIQDLSGFLGRTVGDGDSYRPLEMRVFVGPEPGADPASPSLQAVTWPLAGDPATAGKPTGIQGQSCILVSGTDLTRFLAVATSATSTSVWTAPSGRFGVAVRPLYPNETGC